MSTTTRQPLAPKLDELCHWRGFARLHQQAVIAALKRDYDHQNGGEQ